MPVFDNLVAAYAAEGYAVSTGLNPTAFHNLHSVPFTWLIRDGVEVADGLGISLPEIYLLECLAAVRPAESILVIGNSFGWSTLALALAQPQARVVGLDSAADRFSLEGLELTARIAGRLGLDRVSPVRGTSPVDIPATVEKHLGGQVDLAFVDGHHTSEQIVAEYRALRPLLTPDAMVLFHDVQYTGLQAGFDTIVEESGWQGRMLHATPSGIGFLTADPSPALARVIAAFATDPSALEVVRRKGERFGAEFGS
ncbi:class I SAM-dependent methyltransferase [Micromonospora sp. WMMD987]|uniref:class I SAM-dependent methyltransferase n=1 Tax=Micromonospora TaxID=1873 RepID=UPI00249C8F5F|nr:class I SAM-dependent methyltransferase [Micromonospora sp. WMMD987]WFE96511.1 class I SAM-dependent methyltransferase [Micromonospora sp. WMMD987]